jgi:hypothetical protein
MKENQQTSSLKTFALIAGGSVAFAASVSVIGLAVNLIPSVCSSNPTCPFKPTPKVAAPAYTRWNNPNVKPFAESPYYQGGYTDTVYWDESTQQWYCKVEQYGATRCQDAEGETKEQIAEAGAKARAGRAELDAQQRALNEYWCGAFEDPKKTGCREL